MSALATLMRAYGHEVSGSDRSHDRGESPEKFDALAFSGIKLFPQDGSGVHEGLEAVIVSSAVEKSIPDVKAALDRDIAVRKRAYLLAQLFNAGKGIGISGTSGKTTVTAMTGHIMAEAGRRPTIVNGGVMLNDYDGKTATGNAVMMLFSTAISGSKSSIEPSLSSISTTNQPSSLPTTAFPVAVLPS